MLPVRVGSSSSHQPQHGSAGVFKYKVEQVREEYLQDSGVTQALKDALRRLFAEPHLPSNPYYFLSSVLGAYVDQSPLWRESDDREVVSPYDLEGSLEVLQPGNHLCAHTGTPHCFGLPHVLRLASRDGVEVLSRVLTDGVPDTFFPSPTPFTTRDGCTVQQLSSIQGMCSLWRPSRTDMPEIQVRTDVLVKGPKLEEAVAVFLDVVLTCVEDLAEVPVYYVDGLEIGDPPTQQATGSRAAVRQRWSLPEVFTNCKDWEKAAKRMVLGGKCVSMRCTLLLESSLMSHTPSSASSSTQGGGTHATTQAPATTLADPLGRPSTLQGAHTHHTVSMTNGEVGRWAGAGVGGGGGGGTAQGVGEPEAPSKLRYHMATKTFYFHYQGLQASRIEYDQMQHFGGLPFEALYTGYFTALPAATSYLAMWQVDDKAPPYAPAHLAANTASLKQLLQQAMQRGSGLQAYGLLMHLIMLQDAPVTRAPQLHASLIQPLEVLVHGAPLGHAGAARQGHMGSKTQQGPASHAASTMRGGGNFPGSKQGSVMPFTPSQQQTASSGQQKGWPGGGRGQGGGSGPGAGAVGGGQAAPWGAVGQLEPGGGLFSAIANLMRITSSAAALIQGVTLELEAISSAAAAWPRKLRAIEAAAAASQQAGATMFVQRGDGVYTGPNTGDSRRTIRSAEMSNAMLGWVRSFDLDGRLIEQLVELKARIHAVTGQGLFAGVSILCGLLLDAVPDEVPATHTTQLMTDLQPVLRQLVQLLQVGSMTVAHGFLGRCDNVTQALHALGLGHVTVLDARLGHPMGPGAAGALGPGDEGGGSTADWRKVVTLMAGEKGGAADSSSSAVASAMESLKKRYNHEWQVRSGVLPARLAPEATLLLYCVDCGLDAALTDIWLQVSKPPQPLNPFPKLMHIIRSRAAKMELWAAGPHHQHHEAHSHEQLLRAWLPDLAMLPPPSFMYAAHAPEAVLQARRKHQRRAKSAGLAGAAAQGVEEEARVYGSYAAVALADADVLQHLVSRLPGLLQDRHWQHGAYQGEVIPAVLGDCTLSCAMDIQPVLQPPPGPMLHHTTKAAACAPSVPYPADQLPFCGLTTQQLHLVEGPSRRQAAQAFAEEVVRGLLQLHCNSPHLLHTIAVLLPPDHPGAIKVYQQQQSLSPRAHSLHSGFPSGLTGGGGAETYGHTQRTQGGGVTTTRYGVGKVTDVSIRPPLEVPRGVGGQPLASVTFGVRELMEEPGRQLLGEALVAATKAVQQGMPLATISLYGALQQETTYLPLQQQIVFQHAKAAPQLRANQAMTVTAAPAVLPRPTTAERDKAYWDRAVYERVFVSESGAQTWWRWNAERGDPAQPFHQQALLADVTSGVRALLSAGRLLESYKLALRGAVVLQEDVGIYELSRSCCSAAQELAALVDLNHALVAVLSDSACDPLTFAKRDNERLRTLFLAYCTRTMAAFVRPSSCYFSSLPDLAHPVIEGLKAHVLSVFALGPSQVADMEQLAVWTRACEISVAAALHDCFADGVRAKWLTPGAGGAAAHSSGSAAGGGGAQGPAGRSSLAGELSSTLVLRPNSAANPGAGLPTARGSVGHAAHQQQQQQQLVNRARAADNPSRFQLLHVDSARYLETLDDEWCV